ncbi:uncharacterized protein LOC108738385 isoform X2 [Agrilus planipennis]|uniref:Uncharacterized protein LOC108738385 isoform X2 n=1 Tax=Agrilus planipennis TaxID=224129 RepID=A0A1W4X4N5_AGRPL|nr:uncharacterized protein LOC108738385 isoform X2 [Agrilus planipennis]
MKYPQLISLPSEISDWLEEQLEARGIDAVVYTRYILSLLHRDTADIICSYQDNQFKAYDKDCGIESLVDELCEKLKQYKNGSTNVVEPPSTNVISNKAVHDVSPLDLARQYYAAFPPLSHTSLRSPGTVLTFMPQCYTSPKKKGTRRRNRSSSCGEKLLYKKECENIKTRTSSKHKYGNRSKNTDFCSDTWNVLFTKKFLKSDSDKGDNVKKEKSNLSSKNFNNQNDYGSLGIWDNCRENEMYEDLPVDIIELLDSPSPHDYTVEMMNLANIKEVGNKSFIHSGTNITSSIWSVDAGEDKLRDDFRENNSETVLGFKFSSLTMDCNASRNIWSNVSEENKMLDTDRNNTYSELFFGNNRESSEVKNHPWHISTTAMKKWSEGEYNTDRHTNILIKSLIKINHNRECSSFIEVCPKGPINRIMPSDTSAVNLFSSTKYASHFRKFYDDKRDDENLLTSDNSHFKPINFKKEMTEAHVNRQYADGTSFIISSNLDKPNYKRSNSGYLYLESEGGSHQKVKELGNDNDTEGKMKQEFVLKFFIKQNDKACQTDTIELESMSTMDVEMDNSQVVPCKKRNISESDFYFPGDQDLLSETKVTEEKPSDIWIFDQKLDSSPDGIMTEIMWKYDGEGCARCNKNQWDNGDWVLPEPDKSIWQVDKDSLRNIWNGGEICTDCCSSNGRGKFPLQSQLREDISQDGEQLLSDLSTLQKTYMEHLPVAEVSYDINELLTAVNDRKRRHSPVPAQTSHHRGSWSLASSVKQDHLMHMNSVPVLHSVTL